MILIADSGSTKTDWILDSPKGRCDFQTIGLNPYFVDSSRTTEVVKKALEGAETVSRVYFYGAGCSNPESCDIIARGIRGVTPNAKIEVEHDLLGAARATCLGKEGIACILGTGSNSCLFDGSRITDNVKALGHVLGDEGSGSYMGKELIRRYYYRELDEDLNTALGKELEGVDVLDATLKQVHPNRFLASFGEFISTHVDHPQIQDLVLSAFGDFLDRHVFKYEGHQQLPVHFVGGIAFGFSDLLTKACLSRNLKIGTVLKRPIEGLIKYHLNGN